MCALHLHVQGHRCRPSEPVTRDMKHYSYHALAPPTIIFYKTKNVGVARKFESSIQGPFEAIDDAKRV